MRSLRTPVGLWHRLGSGLALAAMAGALVVAALPHAAAAANALRQPAGKVVIAQGVEPRSLWGNSSTVQAEINVSEQVTEKLIEFSVDADQYEFRLATDWNQIDDLTLQLKLRQGVSFTNGEPFNADSAIFSLNEMINANAYKQFVAMVDRVDKVDDYTINIITKYPTLLQYPAIALGSFQYPPKYYQQVGSDEFGRKPIGTGPYKFVDWRKDDRILLEANTDYWGGAPAYQQLIYRGIPEGAARIAAIESGDIDLTSEVPLDAIERLEGNGNVQLDSRVSNRMFYLNPSLVTDTPLRNPKVRQAMLYAVDVDSLIRSLLKGRAKRLQGQVLGPNFFGFDPTQEAYPYNPDKAKQMLAEAGYPDGFEITFRYPSGRYAGDKEIGQAVSTQLARVGIRVNQMVLEPGTWLTQYIGREAHDLTFVGNLTPPDAHFMMQIFQSEFIFSYYQNPEFDALLKRAATTGNREERMQIYSQMVHINNDNPYAIPLFQPEEFYARSKKVAGFQPRANQFIDARALKPQ